MNLLYIHWHPSPEIFSIGAFGPRWYGVLFAVAFVVGYYLMRHIFRREGVKYDYIDNLLLYFFIGGSAALTNLICFAVCLKYDMELLPAVIGSYILSAIVNYILCILLLFRHKACWNTFGELAAYTITLAVMGVFDYWITVGLAGVGCGLVFAKALSSVVGFFGNYLLRRYFVFFLRSGK